MSANMVEIKNISFSYSDREVLKDISFDVMAGECVGILGNNGAGKSTLLACLARIREPKTGSVFIDNNDMLKLDRMQAARRISYVAQKNEAGRITVFDTVLLGRKPYFKWTLSARDIASCEDAIHGMGLGEFKLRYVNELSGGEMQKVMLARALAGRPRLLLLDEPTASLDPKNQIEVLDLVSQAAKQRGISVIMVLHDLNAALRYCQRLLFLKNCEVYEYCAADHVTEETIGAVYGVKSAITEAGGRKVVVIG